MTRPGLLAPLRRPRVLGVLNVTPDSFSDGGRWSGTDAAVAHGERLLAEGADLVDVGGESTRPGASRTPETEEAARVVPVVRRLAAAGGAVSIDTMRARVAEAALEAGAGMVNDVSGGLADPGMLPLMAVARTPYVLMHWRAHSARMQELAVYDAPGGVAASVRTELAGRLAAAREAGIDLGCLILDPGIGFAKTAEQSWDLLRSIGELEALGRPLLVGASRKGFLGALLRGTDGTPRPVDEREHAHVALVTMLALRGVWGLRVHDVRACLDALAVVERLGGCAVGAGRGGVPAWVAPTEPPGERRPR